VLFGHSDVLQGLLPTAGGSGPVGDGGGGGGGREREGGLGLSIKY